jgi:cyclopropane fatty-acyl-phospholipid synthase-like methyltransferase
MPPDLRQFAPATERNRDFILPILQRVLPAAGTVLEIGSGSGEHVTYFAAHLAHLTWQPSERHADALASIQAWIRHSGLTNVHPPCVLDATATPWPVDAATAVLAINVLHYSPWETTPALLAGAAHVLPADGVLYCYGPFRRDGRHTAPTNASFDEWLKSRDPRFGVRDLEAVQAQAQAAGLQLDEVIDMPANNFSLIFRHA